MARGGTPSSAKSAFRVLVHKVLIEGGERTYIYGPYATVGAARRIKTSEDKSHARWNRNTAKYTATVQEIANPVWTDVPDEA